MKNDAEDKKDKLHLKLGMGSFTMAELGNPMFGTEYTFFVDSGGGPVIHLRAPTYQLCGDKPCWKFTGKGPDGITDKDGRKPPANDGIKGIVAKASSVGKAKLQIKAEGIHLPPLSLATGLTYPVTATLVNSSGGCWQVSFSSADQKKNDGNQFKAVHKQ